MSRGKSLRRKQTNSVRLCAVWQGLPGSHPVAAVLMSSHLRLVPRCWWRLLHHPASRSVDHNYPPTGSIPAAGPTRNPHITFTFDLPAQENFCLCMNSYGPQQMCTTNLDPPLRSHFLFQSLLLQSFASEFHLYPLILLTPECFWLTLEQMLHEGQLRPEDLQKPLDHRETRSEME